MTVQNPAALPVSAFQRIDAIGNSYASGGFSWNNSHGWVQKVNSMIRPAVSALGGAIGGTIAQWQHDGLSPGASSGDAGFAYPLQNFTAGGNTPNLISFSSLVLIDTGFNDLAFSGQNAAIPPLVQAVRVMMARYSANAIFENEDATVTHPAGWTAIGTTVENSGVGYFYTLVNGNTLTIAVPAAFAGGTVHVGGVQAPTWAGASCAFTIGGVAAGSIAPVSAGDGVHHTGWVKRFTGLAPGAHTIVGTWSGLSASIAGTMDYWGIESPQPPVIVLHGLTKPLINTLFGYGSVALRDAGIDQANAALQALCGEFPNCFYVDTASVLNKNPALFASDGLHPNDLGYTQLAIATLEAIQGVPLSTLAAIAT